MSSSTSTTGNGAPASAAMKTDFEALKNDMKALRADLAALLKDTGAIASEEAKRAAARAGKVADSARDQATEYKDVLEDKVREHPFAAVGIALAAGFVLAALTTSRR
ncbi:MAG: DUF883 C-terminal domain-containing protein [Hyphomonadaceae bacterium]|nr:DUF883 C-terminal domain-containing protein [Hyphomonadaceae bacterium]